MKLRKVVPALAALLTATALGLSGLFVKGKDLLHCFNKEANGIGLDKLVIVVALAVFYYRVWDEFIVGKKWITHLISVLFSLCMLIGISYSVQGNWNFIFGSKKQFVIAAFAFFGYFILFDVVLSFIYRWLPKHSIFDDGSTRKLPDFVEKHYRLFAFLVIYICWLPYLIIFFPGSVPADGWLPLYMCFGGQLSNKHCWVLTIFMGFLMRIGRTFSDNVGVFLIILVFSLIECFCYATVCYKLKKWKASKILSIGSIAFFGILPVFGAYAQAVIKDSVFSAMLALYMILYVECAVPALQKKTTNMKGKVLVLTLVGMLACLTRNNGVYLVFPSMLLLIFFITKKERILVAVMAVAVFLGYECLERVVAPAVGVEPISTRAYFSIPFQQTARYLVYYPDDVTEDEKEAINRVLVYEQLAELYRPDLSDPVKDTYRTGSATKADIKNYFGAWYSMFKRHPKVYFEATLHNTYGYYYPFYHVKVQGSYRFYTYKNEKADFKFDYVMPEKARTFIKRYADTWDYIPGLAQLCNSGTYTWILIILAGYLIYRKRWKGILALAAPALNVAVCIASPVNGLLRYTFPLIACMPAVIFWGLAYGEKEFVGEVSEEVMTEIDVEKE